MQDRHSRETILRAFEELEPRTHQILSIEMALTGIAGHHYSCVPLHGPTGPAFLAYHAPSVLRKLSMEAARRRAPRNPSLLTRHSSLVTRNLCTVPCNLWPVTCAL